MTSTELQTQASLASPGEVRHRFVTTNGVALHVVTDGPQDGQLVILLHGFPEYWYGWRRQIPALAEAGFAVWAPDQRGYNLSDKPRGSDSYNLDALADDIVGLIDAAGREKAFVVGHDWGGAVAWWLARVFPERVEKLVILNSPHGSALSKMLQQSRAQRVRSAYMLFFQVPVLPELILGLDDWGPLLWLLGQTSNQGAFSQADLTAYRQAFARPRAMTSMLQWYRTNLRSRPRRRGSKWVSVPTLLLWGSQDSFFAPELAPESIGYCENARLLRFEHATHWLHLEQPEQVNQEIITFLETDMGRKAKGR
jgi:pimeloyl-ACP methyl ester carboxylesterase